MKTKGILYTGLGALCASTAAAAVLYHVVLHHNFAADGSATSFRTGFAAEADGRSGLAALGGAADPRYLSDRRALGPVEMMMPMRSASRPTTRSMSAEMDPSSGPAWSPPAPMQMADATPAPGGSGPTGQDDASAPRGGGSQSGGQSAQDGSAAPSDGGGTGSGGPSNYAGGFGSYGSPGGTPGSTPNFGFGGPVFGGGGPGGGTPGASAGGGGFPTSSGIPQVASNTPSNGDGGTGNGGTTSGPTQQASTGGENNSNAGGQGTGGQDNGQQASNGGQNNSNTGGQGTGGQDNGQQASTGGENNSNTGGQGTGGQDNGQQASNGGQNNSNAGGQGTGGQDNGQQASTGGENNSNTGGQGTGGQDNGQQASTGGQNNSNTGGQGTGGQDNGQQASNGGQNNSNTGGQGTSGQGNGQQANNSGTTSGPTGPSKGRTPGNAFTPIMVMADGSYILPIDGCISAQCESNGWQFFDPEVATGFTYHLIPSQDGDTLTYGITQIQVPSTVKTLATDADGDSLYALFLCAAGDDQCNVATGEYLVGNPDQSQDQFDVVAYLNAHPELWALLGITDPSLGISGFALRGIDPDANVDPTDPLAFVAGLTFTGIVNGMLQVTPETPPDPLALTEDVNLTNLADTAPVPEPASSLAFLSALGLLGAARKRRRRAA